MEKEERLGIKVDNQEIISHEGIIISNIKELPIAFNVCEQVLREVEKQPTWSMAHVIMNPLAKSLLHNHERMSEIYVITKGYGELEVGSDRHQVAAGSTFEIPLGASHMLENKSSGQLEHLVFALPPFDPTDINLLEEGNAVDKVNSLSLPQVEECFDGAKIISYPFPQHDLSIAFGWVINESSRRKQPHYHKEITEFAYVVEGKGLIDTVYDKKPVKHGDWIRIDPEVDHGFINESPEDMVVVCVCSPSFSMEDVHRRRYHI